MLWLSILVLLVHGREALHGVLGRPRRWGVTGRGPVVLLPGLLLLRRVSGVLLAVRCWMLLLLLWRRRGRLGVVLRGHAFGDRRRRERRKIQRVGRSSRSLSTSSLHDISDSYDSN